MSPHKRDCWCGSGKARKRCHPTTRKRSTRLTLKFPSPVRCDSVEINRTTGEVWLLTDGRRQRPASAVLETTYERENKTPKVLNRLFLQEGDPVTSLQTGAISKFTKLYAIDTNTRPFAGGTLSMSGIVGAALPGPRSAMSPILTQFVGAFEFRNVQHNPEMTGWWTLIETIRRESWYSPLWHIGVVVDSQLGALEALNAREQPVLGDRFLPPGFEFLYASGETGRDSLLNVMLANADEIPRPLMDAIERGELPDEALHAVAPAIATGFRLWTRTQGPSGQVTIGTGPIGDDPRFRWLQP
jgi:hypothetical protein